MMLPEDYIKIYPMLPSGKKPLTEEEKLWLSSIEIDQGNKRVIPETITEFNVWDKNGNVSVHKNKESHYDRKGRQTSRFSFGHNESQILEELWRFNENDKLDEYFRRYIRGEADFTKFIYYKNIKLEKIIRLDLSEFVATTKYLIEYNGDDNISCILKIGIGGLPEETTAYTYDANKILIKKEILNAKKELIKFFEYEYNAAKLVSKEKTFTANGSESSNTVYTYDDFNRLIEKKTHFKTGIELMQNGYKDEYLISIIKELIIDGKSSKRNQWVADTHNFTITEKNFGNSIHYEQTIQFDENWLPQRGVVKSFNEEIDSYELRFRTSIHA